MSLITLRASLKNVKISHQTSAKMVIVLHRALPNTYKAQEQSQSHQKQRDATSQRLQPHVPPFLAISAEMSMLRNLLLSSTFPSLASHPFFPVCQFPPHLHRLPMLPPSRSEESARPDFDSGNRRAASRTSTSKECSGMGIAESGLSYRACIRLGGSRATVLSRRGATAGLLCLAVTDLFCPMRA